MTAETTRIAPAELAALVGSRLCHDLVSPLGAIGNGVELLEMSGGLAGAGQSPELRLISESVGAARNRIQVFRMAFGLPSADQRIGRPELLRLVAALSGQGRLAIELDAGGDFARAEIRMLILALMCMDTAMPWGGRVIVLHDAPGWRLVGESDRTRADPSLWSWLDGRAPCRTPAPGEVQFALLAEAAAESGRSLHWELDDNGAEITF
ncbi:histidine phosphotransferase family protein [Paracoccus sp. (in: a-proteobacteria)]|uniref:histidine phosphotransferase family protein n=1 Tax=Paracoccus sp. TaxID=267 RepID=UPI003A896134